MVCFFFALIFFLFQVKYCVLHSCAPWYWNVDALEYVYHCQISKFVETMRIKVSDYLSIITDCKFECL